MIFLNISADQISIQGKDIDVLVPYDDLERALPQVLSDVYKKSPFDKARVLNWPGGFTLLRIGCLVLNTLQMTLGNNLQFYSCTKVELFKHLIKKWFLPAEWLIFIGQKKNVWRAVYDKESDQITTSLVTIDSLSERVKGDDYFVDQMFDHPIKEHLNLEKMITCNFDGTSFTVSFMGEKILVTQEDLDLHLISYLQPEYMIQPEIN